MEQEHYVTFMKRGNERTFNEGTILDNKDNIFAFNPDIMTVTRLSEKELESLLRATKENIQKMLEIYI